MAKGELYPDHAGAESLILMGDLAKRWTRLTPYAMKTSGVAILPQREEGSLFSTQRRKGHKERHLVVGNPDNTSKAAKNCPVECADKTVMAAL